MAPYALTDRRAIIITTLPHTSDGKKHNNPGALSLSIYTAGALNSTINQSIMSGASTVPTSLDKSQWNDSHMLGVLLFNKGKEIQTKTKHYLPIRAGLSVGYRILPRLSVESGLTYRCLISDLSFGSESHYLSGSQTLHYIGLPLGIRYNAFSWKKIQPVCRMRRHGRKMHLRQDRVQVHP